MQRRTLLKLGLGASVTLAVLGGGMAWLRPGLSGARLSEPARALMRAVAEAVLDGSLPADTAARATALDAHLERLQAAIAGFPPSTRSELSQLLSLRVSGVDLRRQVYQALRDLTNAAYYADASTWPLLGYPGPRALA